MSNISEQLSDLDHEGRAWVGEIDAARAPTAITEPTLQHRRGFGVPFRIK